MANTKLGRKTYRYSDGQLLPSGATGCGYTILQNDETICEGSDGCDPAEVFDAMAVGALESLRAAVDIPDAADTPIMICLDNLAAATCLQGTASDSSQAAFLKFQETAANLGSTHILRTPEHTSIPENERGGTLAKAGCALSEPSKGSADPCTYPPESEKRDRKKHFRNGGKTTPLIRTRPWPLKPQQTPEGTPQPSPALYHLLAARTRHGDFADYHVRFNHGDARIHCSCNRRKYASHIFYCRKVAQHYRMMLTAINRAIRSDFKTFNDLQIKTRFFSDICPAY